MEIVSGPVGFREENFTRLWDSWLPEGRGCGRWFESEALARPYGMRGPALRSSHRSNRKKKECCFISVWWFCSSLWLSLTSGKLLNVIFCALFRKESVWFCFSFFSLPSLIKKMRSQIKSVLVWCDRVNSKRKQMDTVFTRREKGRRDWRREHSLWVRVSGRKSCFR